MYTDMRYVNIQATRKAFIGELFNVLFKFAPPHIQALYDGLNCNNAIRTLQSNEVFPIEKFFAAKTIDENNTKYLRNL